jgi:fatty-acyl-CoA synthase
LFTNDLVEEHVDFVERLTRIFPGLGDTQPGSTPHLPEAPRLDHIVLLGNHAANGMVSRGAFAARAGDVDEDALDARQAQVSADDPALMLYTSGTTAMPKGCPLKHRQFVGISRQIAERLDVRDGGRLWNALPMFHASSLLPMLAAFQFGSTFFSQVHFDADEAVSILVGERATLAWPAYTTTWQPVLTADRFDAAGLSGLRAVLCVGPEVTLTVTERALPSAHIVCCYGITEGSGVPVMCDVDDPASIRLGSCGLPFNGVDAVIRDPQTRAELPVGERGMLWLRGEYVIDGYWNDPVKTAEVFDADQGFCTGDLASVDDAGRIYFHGRLKDTLKVGGENVAAVEVEAFLTTHPAVKLAAVVGVPDVKYGEVPAAFVELRAGAAATEEQLSEFCRQSIAGFKVPRHVRFVTEWPMSATKVRKDELRAALVAELGLVDNRT